MLARKMVEVQAIIQNEAGIHCRPTALLVNAASEYAGSVTVKGASGQCRLGSALELMMLGLSEGDVITLQVEGPDEAAAAERFKTLFETHFDFPNAGGGGPSA